MQKSNRPIWETKLSIHGPITETTSSDETSYEMIAFVYNVSSNIIPDKTIVVDEKHYGNILQKYGVGALLNGISLSSLLTLMNNEEDDFADQANLIASDIIHKMEQDSFFDNYSPSKMKSFIRDQILALRDKFDINPK